MPSTIRDELILTWKALECASSEAGWSRMNIGSAGSVSIMAGLLQPGNEEALVILFPSLTPVKASNLPQGGGFQVICENFDSEPGRWIAVVRTEAGPFDLFSLMAADIADTLHSSHIYDEAKKYQKMLGRIRAWQLFMKPGRDRLTLEEELGLVGELYCVQALIGAGAPAERAINSWTGPEDGIQDFEIGIGALEVKSTLAVSGFPAKIQSLEQLDDSQRQPLIVAGCRFSLGESGSTLPERINQLYDRIRDTPGCGDRLDILLLRAGFHISQADLYTRRFVGPELQLWLVDDFFPRLTMSLVPTGIHSAFYSIDLEKAGTKIKSMSSALIMLEGD